MLGRLITAPLMLTGIAQGGKLTYAAARAEARGDKRDDMWGVCKKLYLVGSAAAALFRPAFRCTTIMKSPEAPTCSPRRSNGDAVTSRGPLLTKGSRFQKFAGRLIYRLPSVRRRDQQCGFSAGKSDSKLPSTCRATASSASSSAASFPLPAGATSNTASTATTRILRSRSRFMSGAPAAGMAAHFPRTLSFFASHSRGTAMSSARTRPLTTNAGGAVATTPLGGGVLPARAGCRSSPSSLLPQIKSGNNC